MGSDQSQLPVGPGRRALQSATVSGSRAQCDLLPATQEVTRSGPAPAIRVAVGDTGLETAAGPRIEHIYSKSGALGSLRSPDIGSYWYLKWYPGLRGFVGDEAPPIIGALFQAWLQVFDDAREAL